MFSLFSHFCNTGHCLICDIKDERTCSLVLVIIFKYLSCGLTEISKGTFFPRCDGKSWAFYSGLLRVRLNIGSFFYLLNYMGHWKRSVILALKFQSLLDSGFPVEGEAVSTGD